jgi:hypothetical protein
MLVCSSKRLHWFIVVLENGGSGSCDYLDSLLSKPLSIYIIFH